ncbi:MAG: class I SAM-dependent methyltransferase [Cyanobium sp. MAG06]|nr:class I SAM-dependent methyltransferase [Cyanobium sp. MAG06]
MKNNNKSNNTSWGSVADKYNEYLISDKNYHSEIIIPNILRLIGNIKGKNILDIACGQGVLSQILSDNGAMVSGFDIGENLIKIAKNNDKKGKINYCVADAEDFANNYLMDIKKNKTNEYKKFDIIICILAVQNIENVKKLLENISNVSNIDTKIYFVLNHPAFRIPKASS